MYHKLSIEETMKTLDVNPETGLSDKEAKLRTPHSEKAHDQSSFARLAASAFSRPVIYLLLVAMAISVVFRGIGAELFLILAVIVINVIFTAVCKKIGEKRLSGSITATVTHAIVLRNGAKMKLSADKLVVGDVVTIKPGRVVPADLRLISSDNLVIDESALTGELTAEKDCDIVIPDDVPVERRYNCAFEGTVVTGGRGDGIVIATGMSTEMSRTALPLDAPEKDSSPVFSRLIEITKTISLCVGFVCVSLFAIGVIRTDKFLDMILITLALAVALMPESVFTASLSCLARGAGMLNKNGFLPKSMKAVEDLGEVTVLCTDIPKLGVAATYTNGRIHTPQDEDTVPFIDGLLLCNLHNSSLSSYASNKCDAEEVLAKFPKIGELSGEVSTTLHSVGGTTISYTGGAPKEILERSELIWEFGKIRSIHDTDRESIAEAISTFAEEGYSLTALGLRSGDEVPCDTGLVFLGIVATRADDEEAETPDTAKMQKLGVKVYLLTQSDAEKARLGATSLSIPTDNLLSGRDLRSLTDKDLRARLSDTFVFSGLSAQDKVRIIHALKSRGEVVAAIGDEISDSPALEAADVGISDDHATDAAKDASDVIFRDRTSADGAIHIGKEIRSSMRKVLSYLIGANLAELVCTLLWLTLGFGFLLSPLQILLLNLVTDTFPALILAHSGGIVRRRELIYVYVLGVLLGIVATLITPTLITATGSAEAASWAITGIIAAGELLLAIPVYFGGRKK